MGRGRAPCCDKSQVKRGPWSPAEDLRLITFIQKHGHENWRALPKQAGLLRCGKSCRLRWINYLRPDVKRGNFTKEEEDAVIKLHESLGNKWSKIASQLPGRTDNEIKNVWNTHLKKRLASKKSESNGDDQSKESSITTSASSSTDSFFSHGKQHNTPKVAINEQACKITPQETIEHDPIGSNEQFGTSTEDPKEISSLSMSSYDSNLTNSSQADVYMPKEQTGPKFNYKGPRDVHINALQEVNKPDPFQVDAFFGAEQEMGLPFQLYDTDNNNNYTTLQGINHQEISKTNNNVLDIPLESDFDFWNMLDNIGCFQQPNEVQATSFEGECGLEGENKKWFQYLENELGLGGGPVKEETQDQFLSTNGGGGDNDAIQLPLDPQRFQSETMKKAEHELGMSYFQLGPSSWPQNLDFQ